MDIRKVKKLIELLEESGIAEIEIKEGEEAVRISRYPAGVAVSMPQPAPAAPLPPPVVPAGGSGSGRDQSEDGGGEQRPDGHRVLSPMVGTYYEAPAPGAAPFVKVGDTVSAGDTLCVIEAMKMMNQIEAEVDGRIAAILVTNGEAVEFGQPLFIIT